MSEKSEFTTKIREKFLVRQKELTDNLNARANDDFVLLGKIVHYHQVVEDSIMRFLQMKMPDHNSLDKRLKMYGAKVEFFKGFEDSNIFERYFKGLEELGRLRNKFAHTLNYGDVQPADYKEIKVVSDQFKEYLKIEEDLGWIGDAKLFSIFFVTVMDGYISIIESKTERLDEINEAYTNMMESFSNQS
jgi:hypothetical protein